MQETLNNADDAARNGLLNIPLVLTDAAGPPSPFLDAWPEGGDFYRATQHGAIQGFDFGYIVAMRAGMREAVVPYFIMNFRFNTMLKEGLLKRFLDRLSVRIACVGHPTAAFGRIDGKISAELLEQVFRILSTKAPIVAYKGFGCDLPVHGFTCVQTLPIAMLHVEGDFLGTLNASKKHNDLMHKLKMSSALRFEEHEGLPVEYLDQVHRLYMNTYGRATVHFECLSPAYFSGTSSLSVYLLAFLEDRLVGFAQLLPKGSRAVVKYVGMDYTVNRKHGVYFALFLRALEACIRKGVTEIEYGETSYAFKKELGCKQLPNWIHYRHRNSVVNMFLSRMAFLLKPSKSELL